MRCVDMGESFRASQIIKSLLSLSGCLTQYRLKTSAPWNVPVPT